MVKCSVFCYGYVVVRTIVLCNLYKNRKNIVYLGVVLLRLQIKYKTKKGSVSPTYSSKIGDWVNTRS